MDCLATVGPREQRMHLTLVRSWVVRARIGPAVLIFPNLVTSLPARNVNHGVVARQNPEPRVWCIRCKGGAILTQGGGRMACAHGVELETVHRHDSIEPRRA